VEIRNRLGGLILAGLVAAAPAHAVVPRVSFIEEFGFSS
jgi:hypothetical protein